jgi:CRP/FNR family cyclic AMP-dependent transcriptional regulator
MKSGSCAILRCCRRVVEFAQMSSARTPYGLNIIDNCFVCPVREEHVFCHLTPAALEKLNEIKATAHYPKSAMLFVEGQQPRGVFVLCSGRAKLSASSRKGKTVITAMAGPGDVLGLSATISNHPYEVTVEMVEPGQANFIARNSLLEFLKEHGEVTLRVAEQLSRNYYAAHESIRMLGLAASPAERLATLLLSWAKTSNHKDAPQLQLTLTHEEIAEMIGATRETVSRLFSDFKKKQLIQMNGATLVIADKAAMENLIEG